jgi:hypothetical protein
LTVFPILEEEFHRQLGNAWVSGLPGPEGPEGRVVIKFVEGANLISAIDCSGTDALGREVGMVQDVKVLGADGCLPWNIVCAIF